MDVKNILFNWFYQEVVSFLWYILYAPSTVLGNWIPNVCVVLQYFALTFEIIRSRLQRTFFIHHLNAGSSYMLFATAHLASPTWFESLTSFNGIQIMVPSLRSTSNIQPLVVFLYCRFLSRLVINPSILFNALPSAEWSLISFSTWQWRPSEYTWDSMFSEIKVSVSSYVLTLGNETSYYEWSTINVGCSIPLGLLPLSFTRLVTLDLIFLPRSSGRYTSAPTNWS